MKLSKLIKAYREQKNISLRVLAKEIGVEQTSLFRLERGHSIGNQKWSKIVRWAFSN